MIRRVKEKDIDPIGKREHTVAVGLDCQPVREAFGWEGDG